MKFIKNIKKKITEFTQNYYPVLDRFSLIAHRFGYLIERVLADNIFFSILVLSLPILYITGASSLLLGIPLGKWVLPLALFLFISLVAFLHRQEKFLKLFTSLLLFLLAFGALALFSSQFFDTGYDTRAYHTKAILGLLDGINPYYEPKNWHNYHYPAAHWILSTSLIFWTKSFEASFSLTYVATLVALFVSWRFLSSLQRLSKFWRISLALLLALNPIAVLCFFNGYVDGSLVSILLSSFMMMLLFVQEKEKQQRLRYGIYIFVLLILLINIKFTGVLYGGVLGVTALLYGWAQKVKWQRILHLAGIGAVAVIFGMIVFGFFPYTTNTIKNKHPFYSAFRIDKQGKKHNQMYHFLSDDLNKHTRFGKTWISLFSKPSKKNWFRAEPLPPFSSIKRSSSFLYGFGSFFSGALLLCLTLVFFIRDKIAWIILGGILVSIFVIDVAFDFRLTPQHWWLPIFFLAFFFSRDKKLEPEKRRIPQVISVIIFICLFSISLAGLEKRFRGNLWRKHFVETLIKQGGWYGTPDIELKKYAKTLKVFVERIKNAKTQTRLLK